MQPFGNKYVITLRNTSLAIIKGKVVYVYKDLPGRKTKRYKLKNCLGEFIFSSFKDLPIRSGMLLTIIGNIYSYNMGTFHIIRNTIIIKDEDRTFALKAINKVIPEAHRFKGADVWEAHEVEEETLP